MTANGEILWIGKPTSEALRIVGQWPSPESVLESLINALEAAGGDGTRVPEERNRIKRVALGLRTAAPRGRYQPGRLGDLGNRVP